jgi:nitroimidazol reductase NimA-like FMN-containing flavoprotein (pyridoxamine 5'-phosphate oxidase superfamily)
MRRSTLEAIMDKPDIADLRRLLAESLKGHSDPFNPDRDLLLAVKVALPALLDDMDELKAEAEKQTRIVRGTVQAIHDITEGAELLFRFMEKLRDSYYSAGEVVSLGTQDSERLMLISEAVGPADRKSWVRWAMSKVPPDELAARKTRFRTVLVEALAALDDVEGTHG